MDTLLQIWNVNSRLITFYFIGRKKLGFALFIIIIAMLILSFIDSYSKLFVNWNCIAPLTYLESVFTMVLLLFGSGYLIVRLMGTKFSIIEILVLSFCYSLFIIPLVPAVLIKIGVSNPLAMKFVIIGTSGIGLLIALWENIIKCNESLYKYTVNTKIVTLVLVSVFIVGSFSLLIDTSFGLGWSIVYTFSGSLSIIKGVAYGTPGYAFNWPWFQYLLAGIANAQQLPLINFRTLSLLLYLIYPLSFFAASRMLFQGDDIKAGIATLAFFIFGDLTSVSFLLTKSISPLWFSSLSNNYLIQPYPQELSFICVLAFTILLFRHKSYSNFRDNKYLLMIILALATILLHTFGEIVLLLLISSYIFVKDIRDSNILIVSFIAYALALFPDLLLNQAFYAPLDPTMPNFLNTILLMSALLWLAFLYVVSRTNRVLLALDKVYVLILSIALILNSINIYFFGLWGIVIIVALGKCLTRERFRPNILAIFYSVALIGATSISFFIPSYQQRLLRIPEIWGCMFASGFIVDFFRAKKDSKIFIYVASLFMILLLTSSSISSMLIIQHFGDLTPKYQYSKDMLALANVSNWIWENSQPSSGIFAITDDTYFYIARYTGLRIFPNSKWQWNIHQEGFMRPIQKGVNSMEYFTYLFGDRVDRLFYLTQQNLISVHSSYQSNVIINYLTTILPVVYNDSSQLILSLPPLSAPDDDGQLVLVVPPPHEQTLYNYFLWVYNVAKLGVRYSVRYEGEAFSPNTKIIIFSRDPSWIDSNYLHFLANSHQVIVFNSEGLGGFASLFGLKRSTSITHFNEVSYKNIIIQLNQTASYTPLLSSDLDAEPIGNYVYNNISTGSLGYRFQIGNSSLLYLDLFSMMSAQLPTPPTEVTFWSSNGAGRIASITMSNMLTQPQYSWHYDYITNRLTYEFILTNSAKDNSPLVIADDNLTDNVETVNGPIKISNDSLIKVSGNNSLKIDAMNSFPCNLSSISFTFNSKLFEGKDFLSFYVYNPESISLKVCFSSMDHSLYNITLDTYDGWHRYIIPLRSIIGQLVYINSSTITIKFIFFTIKNSWALWLDKITVDVGAWMFLQVPISWELHHAPSNFSPSVEVDVWDPKSDCYNFAYKYDPYVPSYYYNGKFWHDGPNGKFWYTYNSLDLKEAYGEWKGRAFYPMSYGNTTIGLFFGDSSAKQIMYNGSASMKYIGIGIRLPPEDSIRIKLIMLLERNVSVASLQNIFNGIFFLLKAVLNSTASPIIEHNESSIISGRIIAYNAINMNGSIHIESDYVQLDDLTAIKYIKQIFNNQSSDFVLPLIGSTYRGHIKINCSAAKILPYSGRLFRFEIFNASIQFEGPIMFMFSTNDQKVITKLLIDKKSLVASNFTVLLAEPVIYVKGMINLLSGYSTDLLFSKDSVCFEGMFNIRLVSSDVDYLLLESYDLGTLLKHRLLVSYLK
jgi:hypothetical protein